jgi:hypothetical protein
MGTELKKTKYSAPAPTPELELKNSETSSNLSSEKKIISISTFFYSE